MAPQLEDTVPADDGQFRCGRFTLLRNAGCGVVGLWGCGRLWVL